MLRDSCNFLNATREETACAVQKLARFLEAKDEIIKELESRISSFERNMDRSDEEFESGLDDFRDKISRDEEIEPQSMEEHLTYGESLGYKWSPLEELLVKVLKCNKKVQNEHVEKMEAHVGLIDDLYHGYTRSESKKKRRMAEVVEDLEDVPRFNRYAAHDAPPPALLDFEMIRGSSNDVGHGSKDKADSQEVSQNEMASESSSESQGNQSEDDKSSTDGGEGDSSNEAIGRRLVSRQTEEEDESEQDNDNEEEGEEVGDTGEEEGGRGETEEVELGGEEEDEEEMEEAREVEIGEGAKPIVKELDEEGKEVDLEKEVTTEMEAEEGAKERVPEVDDNGKEDEPEKDKAVEVEIREEGKKRDVDVDGNGDGKGKEEKKEKEATGEVEIGEGVNQSEAVVEKGGKAEKGNAEEGEVGVERGLKWQCKKRRSRSGIRRKVEEESANEGGDVTHRTQNADNKGRKFENKKRQWDNDGTSRQIRRRFGLETKDGDLKKFNQTRMTQVRKLSKKFSNLSIVRMDSEAEENSSDEDVPDEENDDDDDYKVESDVAGDSGAEVNTDDESC